jgi:hypothetical protein
MAFSKNGFSLSGSTFRGIIGSIFIAVGTETLRIGGSSSNLVLFFI